MACEERWEAALGLVKALKAHLVPDLVSPWEETQPLFVLSYVAACAMHHATLLLSETQATMRCWQPRGGCGA